MCSGRINPRNGLVKEYPYKGDFPFVPRPKPTLDVFAKEAVKYALHWELIPAPDFSSSVRDNFKPRKNLINENNIYLEHYYDLEEAQEEMPMLDDIFTGASHLEDGKDRPLSKAMLFQIYQSLSEINTKTVMQYTGYTERHCRKIVSALRVVDGAFDLVVNE